MSLRVYLHPPLPCCKSRDVVIRKYIERLRTAPNEYTGALIVSGQGPTIDIGVYVDEPKVGLDWLKKVGP